MRHLSSFLFFPLLNQFIAQWHHTHHYRQFVYSLNIKDWLYRRKVEEWFPLLCAPRNRNSKMSNYRIQICVVLAQLSVNTSTMIAWRVYSVALITVCGSTSESIPCQLVLRPSRNCKFQKLITRLILTYNFTINILSFLQKHHNHLVPSQKICRNNPIV